MGENISTLTIDSEELFARGNDTQESRIAAGNPTEQLAEGKMMLATWLNLMWTGDSLIRTVSYSPGRLIVRWF
jgi:hypothetical protein